MASKKTKIIFKCKQCGADFHPYTALSKFCSVDCFNKHREKNQKLPSGRVKSRIKKCIECGREFHPRTGGKGIYCSRDCMYKYIAKHRKKKPKRKCKICGTEFDVYQSTQQYCSHKCAGIAITSLKRTTKKKNWKKRTAAGKTNHLDNLWRYAIYELAGHKCEYCGKTGQLNAHHIFSRANFAVRWDLDNGICLCVSHHIFGKMSFHKAPAEMIEWIKEKRGIEWYERLKEKSKRSMSPRIAKETYKEILKGGNYDAANRQHRIDKNGERGN